MSIIIPRSRRFIVLLLGLLALISVLNGGNATATPSLRSVTSISVMQTVCANPIIDNGTFVSSVGTGPGGTDLSILESTTYGDTIIGFGSSIATNIIVSDEFTLTAMTIPTELTFYAYQTGSTTTSTFLGVHNLALYDGPPGAGGTLITTVVTPTMLSSDWTGVYRVTETAMAGTTRPIMNITVAWPFGSLQPGTY